MGSVWGDPKDNTTWAKVDDASRTRWEHPTTDYVTAFCRPRFSRRVVAIKGASGNRPIIEASHTKGSKVFIVGVDGGSVGNFV